MHICTIPSIYFYAFNSNKKKVYLAKEVVDFILLHKLTVFFENFQESIIYEPVDITFLLETHPALKFYYGKPNSNYKPKFHIMSKNLELITLFRMSF